MLKSRLYTAVLCLTVLSLFLFVVLWFYLYNRYNVLYYHERMQLFRFDAFYFRSYIIAPGGFSGYLGSFLTMFFYYPFAGSVIISTVLTTFFLLFYRICNYSENLCRILFMPFIPTILLMTSFADINFSMAAVVGLLLSLAGTCIYRAISAPLRHYAGPLLFAAVYLIAGGNALLMTAMIVITELTENKQPKRTTALYLLLLIAWSAFLPWLAWRFIYTVTVSEAYFAYTPVNFAFPTIVNILLWLSLPTLYIIVRLLPSAKTIEKYFTKFKFLVLNFLIVAGMTAYSANSVYDSRSEMLDRMIFEYYDENWDSVMSLGKNFPGSNQLASYLTNIALVESGQMPYRMFQYRQRGPISLFLDWHLSYFSLWYSGEIYYRLGFIPVAEHCAFEALVANTTVPNSQTLKRLVNTNIARRDSATAVKYLNFFEKSPIYRKWAKQQKEYLALFLADSTFRVPGIIQAKRYDDFFIDYNDPYQSLNIMLQSNPDHRKVFEYLMAYCLLTKDLEIVKFCFDNYYNNFDYQGIPTHYEEALMAYKDAVRAGNEFYEQYPVSWVTQERFHQYAQAYRAAQGSRRNLELLERQFGETYWFYLHFIEHSTLIKRDESNRY